MTINQKYNQLSIEYGHSPPVVNGVILPRRVENGGVHPQGNTLGIKNSSYGNTTGNIIDIRKEQIECSQSESLRTSIKGSKDKPPCLPSMLLWNEKGLKLFEAVTHLKEYYLNHVEMDILEQRSDDIARRIRPNSMVIDLGSGQVLFFQDVRQNMSHLDSHLSYLNSHWQVGTIH